MTSHQCVVPWSSLVVPPEEGAAVAGVPLVDSSEGLCVVDTVILGLSVPGESGASAVLSVEVALVLPLEARDGGELVGVLGHARSSS